MSKELEALNYLVNLAVVGNKENNREKVFTSEEIILQALKRNEPMKRILHQSVNEKYPELLCPSCFVSNDPLNHYCPKCGQKLDWSGTKYGTKN